MSTIVNEGSKPTALSTAGKKILRLDNFSQQFRMKFDEGESSLPTWSGTLLTFLLTSIVAIYSLQLFGVFYNKGRAEIFTATDRSHFSADDEFNSQGGLNIAVAFTGFDGGGAWILDESYGDL